MRLHNRNWSSRTVNLGLLLIATTSLSACAASGGLPAGSTIALQTAPNGPQADYPIVIGEPYDIEGTHHVPADVMNFDQVGYVIAGEGDGVTGAHHTLPIPSYVEVTSLESGRTILVRLEKRGPMESNDLIALSPLALHQLGAVNDTPVRVRRVNPPEDQRALLRSGLEAPLRMDTPMSLVQVLRRRLPNAGATSLAAPAHVPSEPQEIEELQPQLAVAVGPQMGEGEVPLGADVAAPEATTRPLVEAEFAQWADEMPDIVSPSSADTAAQTDEPNIPTLADEFADLSRELPEEVAAPPVHFEIEGNALPASEELANTLEEAVATPAGVEGGFVVQAAAFSSEENAMNCAEALGGNVSRHGQYYRVRTGPFLTRAQAEASLANVQAAGYSDARILTTS